MNRVSFIRTSLIGLVLTAGAIGSTGCTSVREHQIDAMTGQVNTVNRKQFFVKSIFNRGRDRTRVVNNDPTMAAAQMNGQYAVPQGYVAQPQMAPQYAPQYAPQAAPQMAPQFAPQSNAGAQPSPFGGLGR